MIRCFASEPMIVTELPAFVDFGAGVMVTATVPLPESYKQRSFEDGSRADFVLGDHATAGAKSEFQSPIGGSC